MNLSELINEIVSEWAYRVNDGMPDAKNPIHVKELSIVLNEMGLSHIKDTLIENLLTEKGKTPEKIKEADKNFTNPILNKKVNYKAKDGSDKEGIVGNLLRQPEGTPARDAAEKMLPPEGSEERDSLNKELGGEGQPKKPEDGKEAGGGEEGGAPKEDPIKKAAHMFDPKVDPAMASRLDKEKAANDKLVQKDKEASDREAELSKKDEPTNEFNPINAQDVAKEMPGADPETFGGGSDIPDGVEPEQLKKFNTDISKVAQQVADAKAKGEPAPNINLCDVTVPGTNLYCDDNLGIPRDEMPQFKGNAAPGSRAASMDVDASGEVDTEPVFKEMLKEKGIKTLQTEIPADRLKATQKDLVGAKVVGMMGALEKDPNHPKITAPIYVSRDGHVIDGHHRWAAIVAHNAANPDKQIPMKTTVLDMDIKDAIPMANKFAEDMGIAAKKADANKETPSTPTSVGKNGLTDKVKKKIENWTKEEKAFFEKNEGAPGSKERRSLGQALKDKAAGAWKAIKKGAKHEVEEFKSAGEGVTKFFKGEKLSGHEKKALKAVAIKVVTTAVFGAAFGGLSHGVAAFGKHVAMEFIPHVVGETILKGAGRAALFADMEGEAEMDANMEKFAEMIAKGIEEMEITDEMMEQMVDSYNKKKEENPQKEMTEENLQLAHELMLEMIYGFIDEVKTKSGKFAARSKETNKLVYFDTAEAQKDAVDAGTHTDPEDKTKTNEPIAGASMFDKDYAKDRVSSTTSSKKKEQPAASKDEPVVSDNGPVVTKEISADEDPHTEKGAKEINSEKFNSKQFTQSEITQEQAFQNVETAFPKIKKHDYQYPNGSDEYLKNVMHPAAFEAMDTLIKLSKGGDFVPPISMITNQYGAGKISAQMNELCMQAVMAFPNTDEGIANRNAFIESLRENNKTISKSGQKPILDDTWIDEFAGASDAFNGALDRQYGKGNWKAVGTTWDVRSQNEDRGINYDDKGFSTDINIQIEANGKKENVEISCKKDWKIFLLNAGLGDASNWYYTLGPEKEKRAIDLMQKAAAKIKLSKEEVSELKELSKQALTKAPVSNKSLQANQYKSAQKGAQVIDAIETKELNRIYKQWVQGDYDGGVDKKGKVKSVNDPEFTANAIKAHIKAGIGNEEAFHTEMKKLIPDYKATDKYYKKAVVCINNMLAQTKTDDDAMAWHTSHMGITKKFVQNAAQTLVKDKEYRKMLLRKLQESIPIKTLTEGVETMQIDSMYITKEHMGSLFGTNDWKDIRQYLDVQVINGEGVLTYKAKGKIPTKPISIAKIGIREKGTGYDGNPALEVKPSVQFEAEMRRITKELENK